MILLEIGIEEIVEGKVILHKFTSVEVETPETALETTIYEKIIGFLNGLEQDKEDGGE